MAKPQDFYAVSPSPSSRSARSCSWRATSFPMSALRSAADLARRLMTLWASA